MLRGAQPKRPANLAPAGPAIHAQVSESGAALPVKINIVHGRTRSFPFPRRRLLPISGGARLRCFNLLDRAQGGAAPHR